MRFLFAEQGIEICHEISFSTISSFQQSLPDLRIKTRKTLSYEFETAWLDAFDWSVVLGPR